MPWHWFAGQPERPPTSNYHRPPQGRKRYVRQSSALSQRNKENLAVTEPNTFTTVLPTSPKAPEESKEQTSKLAPSALPELGKLTTDAMEYWRDFAQRSV